MDHSGRDPRTPVASCTLAADRDVLYLFSVYLVRHDVRRDDDRFSYVGLGLTHTDDLLSRNSRAVRRRRLIVRHHGRRKCCRFQRRRRHAPVVRADRQRRDVVRRVFGGRLPVAGFPFPVGAGACAVAVAAAERDVEQFDHGDDARAEKQRQQAAHVTYNDTVPSTMNVSTQCTVHRTLTNGGVPRISFLRV